MMQQEITPNQRLEQVFQTQKAESRTAFSLNVEKRGQMLDSLADIIFDNQDAICDAIQKDYGSRCRQETLMLELSGLLSAIRYTKKHLKKWAKPQKRHVAITYLGAKNRVIPQAKGVVGIVTPWNYPMFLAFSPCISAIAAGNRCVIKMAANSQNLAVLMDGLIAKAFSPKDLALIAGCSASTFSALPWDHLVFTGSAETGKQVMAAAAKNLTPVTLELGGKSPVVVCEDFDIEEAARRIIFTKLLNAGQTCVAPDYVFLPTTLASEFIETAKAMASERYGSTASKDYTAIINSKEHQRLSDVLADAREQGAEIIELMADDGESGNNKLAPAIVIHANDKMRVLQEELFGPVLPIICYDSIDEVLEYINGKERPLAMYLFTNDKVKRDTLINNTMSGAVCVNDTMFHVAQHDMPFGGIGNSGMGHYHAKEGFLEFSKLRPVFTQAKKSAVMKLAPPYSDAFDKTMSFLLKFRL